MHTVTSSRLFIPIDHARETLICAGFDPMGASPIHLTGTRLVAAFTRSDGRGDDWVVFWFALPTGEDLCVTMATGEVEQGTPYVSDVYGDSLRTA